MFVSSEVRNNGTLVKGGYDGFVRPLVHPALEDITVEGILYALSDPTRVRIYAQIVLSGCSSNCSSFLTVSDRAIPKSTLSQHFKVLRDAGLIRSERIGVEMQNASRCAEIEKRFPGLIPAIVGALTIQSGGSAPKPTGRKGKAKKTGAPSAP
jgi:DNA-binding transcriptional ArsR family regulator